MKRIPDDEYITNQYQNKDGWIMGRQRVMFGYRVAVYRDNITINASLCAGADLSIFTIIYAHIYRWLDTNPDNVAYACQMLNLIEHEATRPMKIGNDLHVELKALPQTEVSVGEAIKEILT